MTQVLSDSASSSSVENVNSYGILSRTNGVTSESDGRSTSYYVAPGYAHYLASNHGLITKDVSH